MTAPISCPVMGYFPWRSSYSWSDSGEISTEVHQEMKGYTMNWMEFGHGWPFDRQHVSLFLFLFCFYFYSVFVHTYSPQARR